MPVDWLVVWGVTQASGFLLKPVLEDFAQDIVKDQAKDYVKKCFGGIFSSFTKEPLQKALGKVLKELLTLIEDELLDTGLQEHFVKDWVDPIKLFVRSEPTQEAMRQAFTTSDSQVNSQLFAKAWEPFVKSHPLTDDFSWDRIAKRFSRAVRKLREEDKELREILEAQALPEIAEAAKQLAGLAPKSDLNVYREALLERYANLHFDTLDTTGAYETQRKLWNIFVAQTVRDCQEYRPQDMEVPKEHQRRLREQGEWGAVEMAEEMLEMRRRNYLDQSPRSVLEAVKGDRLPRLVILGDPGSGKSSLLRYLALEWARQSDAAAREAAALPLLIELREYNTWDCPSGKSFVRYLHDAQNWYRLDQFQVDQRLSQRDGAVLLLDGLDEIFDPQRRELAVNDITRFSNEYPNVRIIVTSRVIGYKQQRLSDAEFRHLMLQDLDEPQINDFLERWHNETFDPNRTDREAKKARLKKSISDSRAIRELAGNPLLLTMMAILNRHQELPRDRARLYEQAARVLLHEWDTERTLESHPQLKGIIGYQEKVEMLRDIAYFMQSNAKGQVGNIIARGELERILREYLQNTLGIPQPHALAKALVEQLRERNFILCFLGADSYAFVHRTFLEYFCAVALMQRFQQLLSLDYLKDEVFGQYWNDESWEEILCLIAGMLAKSSDGQVVDIVEYLLIQDSYYPFDAFSNNAGSRPSSQNLFLAARCFQETRTPQKFKTTREQIVTRLVYRLNAEDEHSYYLGWGSEERAKTIHILTWPLLHDDPLGFLKSCIDPKSPSFVRLVALQELARRWKNNNEAACILKLSVEKDDDEEVRKAVIVELVNGWHDDPDTLLLLKDRAANDNSTSVRQEAVRELARGWHDDPDTLPLLKDCATQDADDWVRHMAVQELENGWNNDPVIREFLASLPKGK